MPNVQILVTLTAEAVIEVPVGVDDVEAYCREGVSLEWGGLGIVRIVQPPAVSIAHFALPEPHGAAAEATPGSVAAGAGDDPAARETSPAPADAPPDGALVDAARAIGSTLAKVSTSIESLASGIVGRGDGAAPTPAGTELPVLSPEELLALFTDPLYEDMIRSAVRERAARFLEAAVGEVVAELEPLLRRQYERRHAPGA